MVCTLPAAPPTFHISTFHIYQLRFLIPHKTNICGETHLTSVKRRQEEMLCKQLKTS